MKTEFNLLAIKLAKGILNFANGILSAANIALVVKMRRTQWKRPRFVSGYDYIRFSSLDLTAHEIYARRIPGATAELGVYCGDFAAKINAAFPDRRLYLFDTFSGFDERDIGTERTQNYSGAKKFDFKDTSVNLVLRKMPHKENCIVRKGFFPETAVGIEEKFAFVSIDCDLYEPTISGLNWFWPKLMGGGAYMCMTTTIPFIKEYTRRSTNSFRKIPPQNFSRSLIRQAQSC